MSIGFIALALQQVADFGVWAALRGHGPSEQLARLATAEGYDLCDAPHCFRDYAFLDQPTGRVDGRIVGCSDHHLKLGCAVPLVRQTDNQMTCVICETKARCWGQTERVSFHLLPGEVDPFRASRAEGAAVISDDDRRAERGQVAT